MEHWAKIGYLLVAHILASNTFTKISENARKIFRTMQSKTTSLLMCIIYINEC